MCGILFSNIPGITEKKFKIALSMLRHRGPDDLNYIKINKTIMGATRLAISDPHKRSNQPFMNDSNDILLIFNGEIYNFLELKRLFSLETRTNSDTEILMKLYELKGTNFLKYLNGMFSIVIYDTKNKDFLIARDRLGIKPLFYYKKENFFIISSETKPIKFLLNNKVRINKESITQYKIMRGLFGEKTFYDEIKNFPPGHFYRRKYFYKYWDLYFEKEKNFNIEEIKYLIEDSIKIRRPTDVQYGSFLSGGLDSSIISKVGDIKNTYSIGFKDNNEFEYSRLLHKVIKESKHKNVIIKNDDYKKSFLKLRKIKGEPLYVPNEVSLYYLSKIIRKNKIKVMLAGEGADELFLGYNRIYNYFKNKKKFDLSSFGILYCYSNPEKNYDCLHEVIEKHLYLKDPIQIIRSFFQHSHLHNLLRRLDFSSMSASVESRVPFLDHRLVEKISLISSSKLITLTNSKKLLKQIFKDVIPAKIVERRKVGFPIDLQKIYKSKIKNYDIWFDMNLKDFIK